MRFLKWRYRNSKILVASCGLLLFWPALSSAKVRILTSIFPLRDFAAAVAGDRGDVSLFLPPGAGVHTWQPRPGDIMKVASSDLFISVGANLEPWLSDVLRAVPKGPQQVLEVSQGLALLAAPDEEDGDADAHSHGTLDPHIWLDFKLDEFIVDRIAEALAAVDPGGRDVFRRNGEAYKERLRRLDAAFREGLKGCAGRRIVVAGHAAFGYLARRYGLIQMTLYGLSPDSQPKPRHLMNVVDFCRRNGIKSVFTETSVSPSLAATLAQEIGGRVFVLNAGHNLTRDQMMKGMSFIDIMDNNLHALREGLDCR